MASKKDSALEQLRMWRNMIDECEAAMRDPSSTDASRREMAEALRRARLEERALVRTERARSGNASAIDELETRLDDLARTLLAWHDDDPSDALSLAAGHILSAVYVAMVECDEEALRQPHAWAREQLRSLDVPALAADVPAVFDAVVSDVEDRLAQPRLPTEIQTLNIASAVLEQAPWLAPPEDGGARARRALGLAAAAADLWERALEAATAEGPRPAAEAFSEEFISLALRQGGATAASIRAKLKFLDVRAKRGAG